MDDEYHNQTGLEDDNDTFFDEMGPDNTDYSEETAAEAAPLEGATRSNDRTDREDNDHGGDWSIGGKGYGILALILSIIAFFFLPIVMGAAGIIIGFISRAKGSGAWGGWAIGVGIAALVFRLFAAPFFT